MLDILDSGTTTERIVITWDGMSEMLFYYYYPYYYFTQAGNFFQVGRRALARPPALPTHVSLRGRARFETAARSAVRARRGATDDRRDVSHPPPPPPPGVGSVDGATARLRRRCTRARA